MDSFAAGPPATSARDRAATTERGRASLCCSAAWIVSDPQGGELAACEIDLDVVLNDALGRVLPDSGSRVEVWRA
jgi:hypothetical protein